MFLICKNYNWKELKETSYGCYGIIYDIINGFKVLYNNSVVSVYIIEFIFVWFKIIFRYYVSYILVIKFKNFF